MDRDSRLPSEDAARDVVLFTRRASRRHNRAQSSIRDLMIDLYSNALAVACVVAMAASAVVALRDTGQATGVRALADARWQVVSVDVLCAALLASAFVGLVSVLRRTGPVAVGRAEAAWWLPLPIERRPLVSGPFLRRTGLAGVFGSALGAFLSFVSDGDRTAGGHVLAGTTIGVSVALLVLGTAAAQLADARRRGSAPRRGTGRSESRRGSAALLAVGGAAFVTAVAASAVALLVAEPTALLVAALGTVLAGIVVVPRLGHIDGRDLTRSGAVSGHAVASVYLLDANELRRAFAGDLRPARQGAAARFYRRPARHPFAALLRADVVAFLRLMPSPVGSLAWLVLCVVVALAPAVPLPAQLLMIVVAGCAASGSVGVVARRMALLPSLGALLPFPPHLVRLSGTVMPCLAMALWAGLLTSCLAAVGAGSALLIPLGAAAGIGMGAGAVRGATRPSTDWTTPPVETPFGSIPRDQLSSLLRGTDVTVVSMLPLALALYLGDVTPWILALQVAVSAVGLTVTAVPGSAGPDRRR